MSELSVLGKKVFFLYPQPIIEQVIPSLIEHEFEVYTCVHHEKMKRYLKKSKDNLVFINIEGELDETKWAEWISALSKDIEEKTYGIGVVAHNPSPELIQKYLMELSLECGFITLKMGIQKTTEILLKTLEANEAKGRRKYVRTICTSGAAECTVMDGEEKIQGDVLDFSSVGMSLRFPHPLNIPVGSKIKDMQLSIKGLKTFITGIFLAKREDKDVGLIQVFLFDPASIDSEKRARIKMLIYRSNQTEMAKAFDNL